jgi:two-component system response regulator YesN
MQEKKKILIVEDDDTLRQVLKDALAKEEIFEVWDASDGAIALETIEKFVPDLVLIDINIPKIDGITLARIMMDKKMTDKTKILFLTNSSDISRISLASNIDGVLGYLIKSDWDVVDVVQQIKEKLK